MIGKEEYMKRIFIRIGTINVCFISNKDLEEIKKYFSKSVINIDTNIDFEVFCFYCDFESEVFRKNIKNSTQNKRVRQKDFLKGYYITNHFGNPVNILYLKQKIILYGKSFEKIIWSYVVKYILLVNDTKRLLVKTAAFEYQGKATLIVGRGNAGKTVLLKEMCKEKRISYITNSNGVLSQTGIIGVGSNVRVRKKRMEKEMEELIDPNDWGEVNCDKEYPIKNIWIINYQSNQKKGIREITNEECMILLEEFFLGVNVYNLEEDLLDYYSNDIIVFVEYFKRAKTILKEIIENSNKYFLSVDILKDEQRKEIMRLLGEK